MEIGIKSKVRMRLPIKLTSYLVRSYRFGVIAAYFQILDTTLRF